MSEIAKSASELIMSSELTFEEKPILIGGKAMEYYGIREAGADIDFVIANEDYQTFPIMLPPTLESLIGE